PLLLHEPQELGPVSSGDLILQPPDLFSRGLQLLIDGALSGAPVFQSLLVFLRLAGKARLPLFQVSPSRFDLLFELEQAIFGRQQLFVDPVDLVQAGTVLAARLNAAQLRLVFLLFLADLRRLELTLASLRLVTGQALFQIGDRLDPIAVGAIDFRQRGGNGLSFFLAGFGRAGAVLGAVELVERSLPAQRALRRKKTGVLREGRPVEFSSVCCVRISPCSLKLPSGGSTRIRTEV